MSTNKHQVVIVTESYFWRKRHRFICKGCGEHGLWRGSEVAANADGWYHDDVSLFAMLTAPPHDKPASP